MRAVFSAGKQFNSIDQFNSFKASVTRDAPPSLFRPLVSCPTCDSRHEQDDSKGASQRYERDMSVARLGVAVFGRGGVERVAVAWCHAGFDAEGDWVFVYKTDHATQAQRSRYL